MCQLQNDPLVAERCHRDAGLFIWTLILSVMMYANLSSAFYIMIITASPMFSAVVVYVLDKLKLANGAVDFKCFF
jgi:hypothetical protein